MSTDNSIPHISNTQRKRDEVAAFNKAYIESEKVEVKNRSKEASRKSSQILAMMASLGYLK